MYQGGRHCLDWFLWNNDLLHRANVHVGAPGGAWWEAMCVVVTSPGAGIGRRAQAHACLREPACYKAVVPH